MTDIVGSTRLTEAIGDSIWADHQEAHKALLRSCFTGEGGVEFDDRGDGLSAWFPAPASALRCAVAIQRASAAADPVDAGGQRICVRVALGHGAVTLQPHGNLSGLAVAATTRLLEFAAAGDIVADAAVAAEAYAVGLQATLLGDKTLRNITGTHRVYQIAMSETPPVDGQKS
jgi:class 3 adenylate cyclase